MNEIIINIIEFLFFQISIKGCAITSVSIILIEEIFKNSGEYSQNVQQAFIHKFPSVPVPYRYTVKRLIRKFREMGLKRKRAEFD